MDYFLLDAKSGELRTARPLDKEALPDATGLIVLTIRVSTDINTNTTRINTVRCRALCMCAKKL